MTHRNTHTHTHSARTHTRVQREGETHTDTQTRRHTDTQTHRHTDTQKADTTDQPLQKCIGLSRLSEDIGPTCAGLFATETQYCRLPEIFSLVVLCGL